MKDSLARTDGVQRRQRDVLADAAKSLAICRGAVVPHPATC
jgi:hypothetical protein